MTTNEKRRVPVKEGLWVTPSMPGEEPQLVGSRCLSCGEVYFPKKERGICIHCHQRKLQDVRLSGRGKIASFSVVMQQPGGGYYKGIVPYAYGYVDLADGVRVLGLLTGCAFDKLEVGIDVKLVIEKLGDDDEGNEITTFKFAPIMNGEGGDQL